MGRQINITQMKEQEKSPGEKNELNKIEADRQTNMAA